MRDKRREPAHAAMTPHPRAPAQASFTPMPMSEPGCTSCHGASASMRSSAGRSGGAMVIPFLPMTTFNFSFLTTGSQTIVIDPAVDVINWYRATLIVRVHQIDIASGGTRSIKVGGFGTDPSRDDPQQFVLSSSTLEVTLNSSSAVGLHSDTDTDLYPYLKMYVRGTYNSATARLWAVLSADLVLREAV